MSHTAKILGALVLALFITAPAHAADIQSNLVLHYSFDDAGNLGLDSSGNGFHGTLGGTTTPSAATSSIKGGAAFFNRAGWSRINVPAGAQLGESYTKSVWAYVNKHAGGGGGFIAHPTKSTQQHTFMQSGPNSILSTNIFSAYGPKIMRSVTLGAWKHYVTTYDATTQELKLYIDGVLTDTLTGMPMVPVADRGLLVGAAATPNSTRTFDGPLDEVRVYARALSAEDILALYAFDQITVAAPQNLIASETSGSVSLSFNAVSGAEDYRIEYKLAADSAYTVQNDGVSSTPSAIIAGLTPGMTYHFRVAAIQNGVTSAYSSTATITLATPSQEAPTATNVQTTGTAQVGSTLTGSYTYADAEGDAESGSTYRWASAPTSVGLFAPIPGATATTYVPTAADAGTYLVFEVTPRAGTGTIEGTPVQSAPVLIAALPEPPPATVDITSGLTLHYAFDDAGNLGLDSSGNGFHGVLGGTTTPTVATTSIKGGAAFFNRPGFSRITAPSGAQLGGSYTKSAWVYITQTGGSTGAGIISHPTKVSAQHALMQYSTNTILASNSYPSLKVQDTATKNVWTHVVTTYDENTKVLSLYKNGVFATSTQNVPVVKVAERALMIGSMADTGTTRTFDGPLDEVRVYARVLTPTEITYLYNIDRTTLVAPSGVQTLAFPGRVRVSVAPVDGASDYRVEYMPAGGSSFSVFTDGVSTVSTATVTGLTNGTSYQFRVQALKNGLWSPYSSVVTAVPGSSAEAAPFAENVTVSGTAYEGQILTGSYQYQDVNDDAEGVSTYRWLTAATTTGAYTPIVGATSTTYTVKQSDNNRYLVFEVTPRAATGSETGIAYRSVPVRATALPRFYHVLATGQSLSVGGGPALSTTQPYQNLMLSSVRDAEGNAHDVGPFIPLIGVSSEKIDIPASNTYAGLMHEGGTDVVVVSTAHGVGGQAYEYIKKGTAPYTRGIGQAQLTKQLAEAAGGQYIPLALTLVHGEYDSLFNNTIYDQHIEQLRSDYEADVSALVGSPVTLPLFYSQTSQTSPHRAALLQLKAHRANEHAYLTGPIYQFEYNNPGYLHLTAQGSRDLGEHMGKVMYEVLTLGHDWHPLMPTQITRTGAEVLVKYHVPAGPIVFDTTQVAERANKGFMYWVNGTTTPITAVDIMAPDTVKITLASAPATGAVEEVSYAINPVYGTKHYGDTQDPLAYGGNVRDSDTTTAPGSTSSGKPLYNWAVAFRDPVTVAP